jgi:hypothetical protein
VRQLAQRVGGYSDLAFVGTPGTIADQMEEWLFTEASDGFNVMFPNLAGGLDDFVHRLLFLQKRIVAGDALRALKLVKSYSVPLVSRVCDQFCLCKFVECDQRLLTFGCAIVCRKILHFDKGASKFTGMLL